VIRTRVGYAGGLMDDPDYGNIGDHTETVQIDYDPRRISYTDLLAVFWQNHHPAEQSWSRQYLNAIFFHNEQQKQAALMSKAALEEKTGDRVRTEVLPLQSFNLAEDYHQKYLLKQHRDLAQELSRIYSNTQAFVNSTAVARLNGYAGGHGSSEQLSREIDSLGLSIQGRRTLDSMIREKRRFN
jgi:peptide-methionine (S)-S-oxide reductase